MLAYAARLFNAGNAGARCSMWLKNISCRFGFAPYFPFNVKVSGEEGVFRVLRRLMHFAISLVSRCETLVASYVCRGRI